MYSYCKIFYLPCHSRCIGIVNWGYTEDRNTLINTEDGVLHHAKYKASTAIRHHHPVPLNPDHTHFIMVDNGFRNMYRTSYDDGPDFR